MTTPRLIAAGLVVAMVCPAAAAATTLRPAQTVATSAVFLDPIPTGRPTPAERRAAAAFVTAARATLSRWRDARAALAAGYVEAPGQVEVVHMVRGGWLMPAGGQPDPTRPSALVFLQTNAGLRLAGGMWMMAVPGVAGPQFGGRLTVWHAHVDCRGVGGVTIPVGGGPCPAGDTRETSPEMLHVWLPGVRNPFDTAMDPRVLVCTIR